MKVGYRGCISFLLFLTFYTNSFCQQANDALKKEIKPGFFVTKENILHYYYYVQNSNRSLIGLTFASNLNPASKKIIFDGVIYKDTIVGNRIKGCLKAEEQHHLAIKELKTFRKNRNKIHAIGIPLICIGAGAGMFVGLKTKKIFLFPLISVPWVAGSVTVCSLLLKKNEKKHKEKGMDMVLSAVDIYNQNCKGN